MTMKLLPMEVLETEPFLDAVTQTWIYLPGALHRSHLCLVPWLLLPQVHALLAETDCFVDRSRLPPLPCVVLGTPVLRPDGLYHVREEYMLSEVVKITLLYATQQARQQYSNVPSEENRLRYEALEKRTGT